MSTTFAVSDILADAADLSNSPAFSTTTRITLARATYWLTQSARSLSALLSQQQSDDREFVQIKLITTTPSLRYVSLPTDSAEVHAVVWHRGDTDYVLLKSAGQEDLALSPLDDGNGWADDVTPRWRIDGQTIGLYPTSGISETLELFYTVPVQPSSGNFTARTDFDRWVTLDLCVKIATSKRKDPSSFKQDKALLENDLFARARRRDVNESHTIRDVRSEYARSNCRRGWR